MTFKLSNNSIKNMEGIDLRLEEIVRLAITLTRVDFGIPKTGGLRTVQEQQELFTEGLSKCDGIDKKSEHQSGFAVDIFAYVDGRASWNEHHLSMCATAILQAASILGYKLQWGGLWRSWQDYPHFQLLDGNLIS